MDGYNGEDGNEVTQWSDLPNGFRKDECFSDGYLKHIHIINTNQETCSIGDNPAYIQFYPSGKIKEESWCLNGKYHRVSKPATIKYDEDGNLLYEKYMCYDHVHRDDYKPAFIAYLNGKVYEKLYYTHGVEQPTEYSERMYKLINRKRIIKIIKDNG